MTTSARRSLLAVFAHPDDESFGPGGTLARCADDGVDVHLICATRGEVGESDLEDLGDCEDLACRREQELRCAAEILGAKSVDVLDYRDSGMAGTPANRHPDALLQADVREVAARIAERARELTPQVVLTFGPFGGYGHPDHIAVHNATVAAWQLLGRRGQPPKLFFTTFSPVLLRWTVRLMPLWGGDPRAAGKNRDVDLAEILRRQLPVTTRIDIAQQYERKQRAAACHSTQLSGPSSFMGRMPEWLIQRLQSAEYFHRAHPTFGKQARIQSDLFEGIE
jgi:LmbE family N-acetylglucosaminyl deacetylase